MVPLSERRPRLYEDEIPEVILGLRLRLLQLLEERREAEKAYTAFRCMFRLQEELLGRPHYPKFNWDFIEHLMVDENYTLERIEEMRKRRGKPRLTKQAHSTLG